MRITVVMSLYILRHPSLILGVALVARPNLLVETKEG